LGFTSAASRIGITDIKADLRCLISVVSIAINPKTNPMTRTLTISALVTLKNAEMEKLQGVIHEKTI
jgi:hypothetical protein